MLLTPLTVAPQALTCLVLTHHIGALYCLTEMRVWVKLLLATMLGQALGHGPALLSRTPSTKASDAVAATAL